LKDISQTLILVTNDDGFQSKGIAALIEVAAEFGKVVVVAPSEGQSGMAHAITVKHPLRVHKIKVGNAEGFACNGTPVDCVKLAFNKLLERKPDLILSGINHGSNSAEAVFYSGTMGATIEGCINRIPSIGFSLSDFSRDADFSVAQKFVRQVIAEALENGIPQGTCWNVNIPQKPENEIKGIRICRQNRGYWQEEFEKRIDPHGHEYYWLTGDYHNTEPDSDDTDEWALANHYVSLVPIMSDLTDYQSINPLQTRFSHDS
jgi:5'-nucleotidase